MNQHSCTWLVSLHKRGFSLAVAISLAGDVSVTYLAQITLPASEILKIKKTIACPVHISMVFFSIFAVYVFFVYNVFG